MNLAEFLPKEKYRIITSKGTIKKRKMTNQSFKKFFFSNLELKGFSLEKEDMKIFLNNLFMMDDKEYKLWYKALIKVPFAMIKDNSTLLATLSSESDTNHLEIASLMYKRMHAIIMNSMPSFNMLVNNNTIKDEYYEAISLFNDILTTKDNKIVKKAKNDFIKIYSSYEDDELLGEYYKKLLNEIEKEMLKEAKARLNKAATYQERATSASFIEHRKNTSFKIANDRHSFTKRY